MRKLKTSTRHHHSFVSKIEPDIHLIFIPANTTRSNHGFRNCQKSTGKAQTEAWRLLVVPFTRKGWIKNVEMRQKTVQSNCNNVRRQRFYNKRALARNRYETFGTTEGFREDERQSGEFQRAAKKNCPILAVSAQGAELHWKPHCKKLKMCLFNWYVTATSFFRSVKKCCSLVKN